LVVDPHRNLVTILKELSNLPVHREKVARNELFAIAYRYFSDDGDGVMVFFDYQRGCNPSVSPSELTFLSEQYLRRVEELYNADCEWVC